MIRSTLILLFALLFTANSSFAHGKCCKSEAKSCCEKKVTKCVTKTSCCDHKWNKDDHSVCCAKPHHCATCYHGCNDNHKCAPHSCCLDYKGPDDVNEAHRNCCYSTYHHDCEFCYKGVAHESCAPHSCDFCYQGCSK